MYIILGTCPVIARQLNWELVDQFMTYRTLIILKPNTNGMWRAADKKNLSKKKKKTGTHHMFYCIMARGRIGIPATPKTELPMTISNCFLAINIITKRSISDAAETLNSPLVISMQNSPTNILLDSGQHPEKVFPGHLYALLTEVVEVEVSCVLIFTVPFDT